MKRGFKSLLMRDRPRHVGCTAAAKSDHRRGVHDLDPLWNRPFFRLAWRAFDKLRQTPSCVHIHPNNCGGTLEKQGLMIPSLAGFTFLSTDRILDASYAREFPHPLDRDHCGCRRLAAREGLAALEPAGSSGGGAPIGLLFETLMKQIMRSTAENGQN